jgi:integration host factor subunit alpha
MFNRRSPSVTLTNTFLINAIAEQNEFTSKKSSETIENILEIIKSNLASGEEVLVRGFGKLCVKQKRERRGRNSVIGADIMLPPKREVAFKCSGKLRDNVVNQG